jgi:acyl-CoA synthetase (AMP-forming)/AMP-acid ligase II
LTKSISSSAVTLEPARSCTNAFGISPAASSGLPERLAGYKRVREIEFIEKVPRTASGKILRRELAEKEKAPASPR